jgi:hypothetical protein
VTVLTALTWLAVAVLSAGSVGVFIFFLRDIPGVLPNAANHRASGDDQPRA